MIRIGIWGYFGYRNCGDDLLLINLINAVDDYTQNKRKEICVFGDENNIKKLLPDKSIICMPRKFRNFFLYAFKADYFIIGPGGIFPSTNTKKLLAYYIISLVMRGRRKHSIGIGVGLGIGVFQRKIDIMLLNLISSNYDNFVSRSENYLSFPIQSKITLGADLVFLDRFSQNCFKKKEKYNIVVALANIFSPQDNEWKEKFISEILGLFKYILNKGYRLNFIPFTNEIDKDLHDDICKRLNHANALSFPYSDNPYTTFSEMLKGEYCIGMRFHSLVMSLLNETPCLSISYSDKNEDIMKRCGQLKYSFRFGVSNHEYFNKKIMIDCSQLKSSFVSLVESKEIIEKEIGDNLPIIKQQCKINYDLLKLFLN